MLAYTAMVRHRKDLQGHDDGHIRSSKSLNLLFLLFAAIRIRLFALLKVAPAVDSGVPSLLPGLLYELGFRRYSQRGRNENHEQVLLKIRRKEFKKLSCIHTGCEPCAYRRSPKPCIKARI